MALSLNSFNKNASLHSHIIVTMRSQCTYKDFGGWLLYYVMYEVICLPVLHVSLHNTKDQHEKTWCPTFSCLHNMSHNKPS